MGTIDSKRITRHYIQRIEAAPDRVFQLLCPVREAEWLDGWADEVEMIHSDSGLAEDGCVFRTRVAGRPHTIWMITRHDPVDRVVEFFRITGALVATRLRLRVGAREEGTACVDITYTHTPLGPEGLAFIEEHYAEDAFAADMAFWEESMNHWLRNGQIMRATDSGGPAGA